MFSRAKVSLINPYTLQPFYQMPTHSQQRLQRIMQKSRKAAKQWRQKSVSQRVGTVHVFLELVKNHKSQLATDLTYQMGKPITQALAEVDGMIDKAQDLMKFAESSLKPCYPGRETAARMIYGGEHLTGISALTAPRLWNIYPEPKGSILSILPWNYPLLTAVNSLIPALLAGNSVAIKPSPLVPLTARKLSYLFTEASGLPYLVSDLVAEPSQIESLCLDGFIDGISFVGSPEVGSKVARLAGSQLIPITLELGGKDACYLAPDADLETAIPEIVSGALYNAGQSCCAVERLYINQAIYYEAIEKLVEEARKYQPGGDPLLAETKMGPVATQAQVITLTDQLEDALRLGGRFLLGDPSLESYGVLNDRGQMTRIFPPAIVEKAHNGMKLMQNESFGPVLGIQMVNSDKRAAKLMNTSQYGLTGSVYTKDPKRIRYFQQQLQVGSVLINCCDVVDPNLVWSGRKSSGLGHTLSPFGYTPFINYKSVRLAGVGATSTRQQPSDPILDF